MASSSESEAEYGGGLLQTLREIEDGRRKQNVGRLSEGGPRVASLESTLLGDDILRTLQQVKSATWGAGSDGQSSVGPRSYHDEHRHAIQVDLNDEKHLADLEDTDLIEHMRKARERLALENARRAEAPDIDRLNRDDAETRQTLSALTVKLDEQKVQLQCTCEELHLHALNASRLSAAERPHGYPAPGDDPCEWASKCFGHLSTKVQQLAARLTETLSAIESCERDLVLARRGYETVTDGMRQRLDRGYVR